MKHTPYGMKNVGASAFTLIELLVVMAFIMLLVALTLPAIRLAQARADGAACRSNLRQISAALLFYVAENGGVFPTPDSRSSFWGPQNNLLGALEGAIDPASRVWFCPRALRFENIDYQSAVNGGRIGYFYWTFTYYGDTDGEVINPIPIRVDADPHPNDDPYAHAWLKQGWNPNLNSLVLLTDHYRDGEYHASPDDWQYHAGISPERPLSEQGTHAALLNGSVQLIAPLP